MREIKSTTLFYIAGMGILLLLILLSNRKFIYDERIFVSNLPVIEQNGFSRQLFTEIREQSPGPLYQIVHYLCKPLTRYNPLAMRLVNYVFLWVIIGFTCLIMRLHGIHSVFSKALCIIAIPMTWPLAGMALSEIPALLFCCAALVLFEYSLRLKNGAASYGCSLLGGLCLGLSIIGRSPFLVLFIPFALFLKRDNWKKASVFLFFGSILPAIAFGLWRGLVPPDVASIQSGWNIWYGMLSIGYLALVTLLIVPDWFIASPRTYRFAGAGFVLLSFANIFIFKFPFFPLHSITLGVFGGRIVNYISFICPAFFAIIGLLFLKQGYDHVQARRSETLFVFSVMASVLIVATTAKSSAQFSSRYVAQCIPFIVLYSSFFETKKYHLYFRACGVVIGVCSLAGYYVRN